ncbi:hypothetical protein PHLGIDRAFT_324766 [Phlebiopsis gigantea 11061_1 CR5-6]|uniref:Uncharacterized protein n=1 Tax=Phlebiopsis gigantea (strain 11061_1 CR5-6) TaxID=745531 RepID=A0A0C3RQ86_PHLG1|nr:hypothetical protein PHLGIDRAFT_324766 [Phlebiopsis gigantea 11061_1 CR5-6]
MAQSREASDARQVDEQAHASVADEIRRNWGELPVEVQERWRGAAAAGEHRRDETPQGALHEDNNLPEDPLLLADYAPAEYTAEDRAAVQRMYDDLSAYIHAPDDCEGESAAFACTDEELAVLSEGDLWPSEKAKENTPQSGKT